MKMAQDQAKENRETAWRASVTSLTEHCWGVLQNYARDHQLQGMDTMEEIYNLLHSLEQELESD